jgi:hypothetical protein
MISNIDLAQILAKAYMKFGLTTDEFIVLNSYCMHSGYYYEKLNLPEIENMTGKNGDEIMAIFASLLERGKLEFQGNTIDVIKLYRSLHSVLEAEKSISERIADSKYENAMMGGYNDRHMGQVELVAYEDGVAVTANDSWHPGMWSKQNMLKLADEIRDFANSIDEDFVTAYNNELVRKQKQEEQLQLERQKEREELKQQREIPKSGYILLLQFSNGTHRFTYSTSLLLQQKIENIKNEYGDTVQIVHTLETYDTMKFYHKFIKAQFSNRLIEGKSNIYKLTPEDIEYLRHEKFPSNAMEWFEGPIPE